jgi:hypothetical protein
LEAKAGVQPVCGIERLDVQRHAAGPPLRFVHEVADQPGTDASAAEFRQQGDVDQPDLAGDAAHVQPSDRLLTERDDQEIAIGVTVPIGLVLGVELLREEDLPLFG